jgi:alkanesulfonate monooxygenase SsuD/methylene tetrahydromethanopterin reductase-like flavin-dependent oxidoreductase (luciferase family)
MTMPAPATERLMHLAVALDGAGWHPAAWREPDAQPADLLTAGYWAGLAAEAEAGRLDFVTFEDSLGLQSASRYEPDERTDQVRGRLDSVLIAARVAPLTRHVGLIPTVVVTHTEPFHISKAIATLDYVSAGRAGVRVRVSASPADAALFGRRAIPEAGLPSRGAIPEAGLPGRDDLSGQQLLGDLFGEAADYVEVIRRLWDSWEDDAEIRDVTAGRFVDRGKLHYIDFEGRQFSVKGPSITPRPPQGQPIVAALGHASAPFELIGARADVGFITPRGPGHARDIIDAIRAAQAAAGRAGQTVHVFADLLVYLDATPGQAQARRARLDELTGSEFISDAHTFAGTPAQLADLMQEWQTAGLAGFRLRPAAIPHDLAQITRALVPELQQRSSFRNEYESATLRGLLGLPRPASRYAAA